MISKKAAKLLNCYKLLSTKSIDKAIAVSLTSNIQHQNSYHQISSVDLLSQRYFYRNVRQFQTSNKKSNFYTSEVSHAQQIMGNSKEYSYLLAEPLPLKENLVIDNIENLIAKNWISMNNNELLENFKSLSIYAQKNSEVESIENPKYRGIIDIVSARCKNFNEIELFHFMDCLNLWWITDKQAPVYSSICKAIDEECMKRMPNWSLEEIFKANYHYYKLRISRISEFTWNSLRKLSFKIKNMSPAQLVQFSFFLKVNRNIPVNLYNLEYYVEQNLDKFTVDELGIIAMPFKKYDTPLRSKDLIIFLIQKLRLNLDTINDVTFNSLINVIRHVNNTKLVEELENLLKSLESQIFIRPLPLISIIAQFKQSLLIHDKNLMLSIIKRFENDIKLASIGEIGRVLDTVYTFNYNPEKTSFFSAVENELVDSERLNALEKVPETFLRIVEKMLQVNYYPEKALKIIMDPEFIKKVSKDSIFNLKQHYLMIDYCLELDHAGYCNQRLESTLKDFLLNRHGAIREKVIQRHQKGHHRGKIMYDIILNLKNLTFESAVYSDSLLPHLPLKDMILCYDPEKKELMDPSEKLSSIPLGSIKYAPDDGKNWYVLLIGTFNLVARNTGYPTGFLGMHIRQLNKIGYKTILIPNQKWIQFTSNVNEKQNYLKNILNNQIFSQETE